LTLAAVLCAGAGALLGGCDAPVVNTKVIRGDVSFVALVRNDDPRLEEPGVSGVRLQFYSDPNSLGRKPLGQAMTDPSGFAAHPVELPAAGLARYEIELIARKEGYAHARGTFIMPGPDQTVLVFLNPGVDTYKEPEDLQAEYEQYR
jgi:hypothetical protein